MTNFFKKIKCILSLFICCCLLTGCSGGRGDNGGILGSVIHKGLYENCSKSSSASKGEEAEDPNEQENIQKIYSVFKEKAGWNDEMIAGMCGNFSVESSIQPKRAEADYCLFPDYDKALEEHDAYCSKVFGAYSISLNYSAYAGSDGNYCGYGLAQWTGPRGETLLKTAETIGEKWYSIDVQIAYILYEVQNTRPAYDGEPTSASEAALEFTTKYEGNTSMAITEREQRAEEICSSLSSLTVDTSYTDKIFEYAQKFGETKEGTSSGSSSSKSSKNCKAGSSSGGNSSIAEAAITWCYDATTMEDTTTQTCGSHGRDIPAKTKYLDFFKQMECHNPTMICECSGFSEAIVKWSGADDSFAGSSGGQITHANGSEHWENLGSGHGAADLQPGDVLANANHVFIWVGSELIQEKRPGAKDAYGGSSPNVCEASMGDHAPYFSTYSDSSLAQYEVLRNVKQEDSSKYKEIQDF